MAFIDLGKLKFNWQGDWSAATDYEVDDVVFYGNQTYICTVTHTATATLPPANLTQWDRMSAGFNFRTDGDWDGASTYYRYDVVKHNDALYILSGANDSTNQTPGSAPWTLLQSAPSGTVMNVIGAMEYRDNQNATSTLIINPTVNKGLTVQENPLHTYPGLQFTYEEDGDYGKAFRTPGSIPAETYTFAVTAQRGPNGHTDGSFILTGADRSGAITKKHDPNITLNMGDTLVLNNSTGGHPIDILDGPSGAQVTTGTLTGAGVAGTVTWDTSTAGGATEVAAGTYYYKCTTHPGMLGTITVVDTTNTQGSNTGNGVIDVARGRVYTINLVNNLSNTQNYDLYKTSGGHSSTAHSITDDEGNGSYSNPTTSGVVWTTGSTQSITFSPNETTPDTVYLGNRNALMTNNLVIRVHDMAYMPSWGTAAPQVAAAEGETNNREFTHWQDWYAYGASGIQSGLGFDTTDHQRRPLGEADSPLVSRRVPASPGTASWTVPENVSRVRITCVGGGGGGGSYNTHYYSGHGGGGGGFTSAEYNVTAGTVLTVTPGLAGYGAHHMSNGGVVYGGSGGTTSVTDSTAAVVNISANAGQGGGYYNTYAGAGGSAAVPAGSGIDSTTIISSAGGIGGYGSQQGFGFGSEDYPGGGGGSAGSMYGNGFRGGGSNGGGYSVGHPGGGGIGGAGGFGAGSHTTTPWYDGCAGSGGGSYGPGTSGGRGDSSGAYYGAGGAQFAEGGCGATDKVYINPYVNDKQSNYVRGQNSANWFTIGSSAGNPVDHSISFGARYGDGEQTGPVSGADDTNTLKDKRRKWMGDEGSTVRGKGLIFPVKAFNGVLGRLWGGGGAGHPINAIEQDPHSSNHPVNHTGGCGGAGAGGGGATWTYGGWGVGNSWSVTDWTVWDPANLAWRIKDSALDDDRYYRGSYGGHGGALGGGGCGGSLYHSGFGGIGGGGGGGAGQHSYNSYAGRAGDGGVGYVLIEWKYD